MAIAAAVVVLPSQAAAHDNAKEVRRILEEKLRITPDEIMKMKEYFEKEFSSRPDMRALSGEEKFRAFVKQYVNDADGDVFPGRDGGGTAKGADNEAVAATDERVVSASADAESEVHAAVSPTDTNTIIVSPMQQGAGGLVCPVYYTKDFGKTWRKSAFVTNTPETGALILGGGDPMLAFDASGKAYFSWIYLYFAGSFDSVNVGMFWAYSTDGGASWQQTAQPWIGKSKAPVSALQTGVGLDFYDKQWFACDRTNSPHRGTLYAGLFHVSPADSRMGVRVKAPGAENFTQTTVRVPGGYGFNQFASTDVDNQGNLHLTFFAAPLSDTSQKFMFHSISTDGGKTLKEPVKIAQVQTPRFATGQFGETITGIQPSRFYPCPQFAIDKSSGPHSGNLYSVWTANGVASRASKDLDMYFSRSTDNGATWSPATSINDDGKDNGRHQFYPSIMVNPEGVVLVTWYDRRNEQTTAETEYFIAYSFDGGKTFTKNEAVSGSPSSFAFIGGMNNGFGIGEYHQVLATKGYAIPVWTDGRKNNGNLDIYSAFIPIGQKPSGVERISPVNPDFSAGALYPNPANDRISCAVTLSGDSYVLFEALNAAGKTVMTERRELAAGETAASLSVTSLPAGVYILKVTTRFGESAQSFTLKR